MKQTNREKFLAKLAPFYLNISFVDDAYMFAKYGHRGQKRDDGSRYFDHPRAVAEIVIDELKIVDNWMIVAAALLHDILEDSYLFNESRLQFCFGAHVALWVKLLTKEKGVDYYKRLRECVYWQVLLVKLCDRLHNLRTLHNCSSKKQHWYIEETKKYHIPLADTLISLLPRDAKWRGEYLKREMEHICLE